MFRQTQRQTSLLEAGLLLPESVKRRLDASWAGAFRRVLLPVLLDAETLFQDLYREDTGRPNFSVACKLGVLYLEEMWGLTDQEALDHLQFDHRWLYALGLCVEDAYLSRRSLVGFRSRLVEVDSQMTRLRTVFDAVARAAIEDMELSAARQRVDSTRFVSNIAQHGRVDLFRKTLVHVLKWLQAEHPHELRRLSSHVRAVLEEKPEAWFARCDKKAPRTLLVNLAQWLHEVRVTFAQHEQIREDEHYRLVVRVLEEHCEVLESGPNDDGSGGGSGPVSLAGHANQADGGHNGKPADGRLAATGAEPGGGRSPVDATQPDAPRPDDHCAEQSQPAAPEQTAESSSADRSVGIRVLPGPREAGSSLQSPYDPDAGCGHKGSGYHLQVAETYGNDGPEIITHFGVTPANASDRVALEGILAALDERGLRPQVMLADGGYPSGRVLLEAQAAGTRVLAPVTDGGLPDDAVGRDKFTFDPDTGLVIACPAGHAPIRHDSRSTNRHRGTKLHAFFDGHKCRRCPLLGRCVVRPPNSGKQGNFHLDIAPDLRARDQALDDQRQDAWWQEYKARSGIEATMSELKRAHGVGRLRVRGMARVVLAVSLKVTACNMKRWLRRVVERLLQQLAQAHSCSLYVLIVTPQDALGAPPGPRTPVDLRIAA